MGSRLTYCIAKGKTTQGYNYGITALNPILEGCASVNDPNDGMISYDASTPIDERGFTRSARSYLGTKSYNRFKKLECFEYA